VKEHNDHIVLAVLLAIEVDNDNEAGITNILFSFFAIIVFIAGLWHVSGNSTLLKSLLETELGLNNSINVDETVQTIIAVDASVPTFSRGDVARLADVQPIYIPSALFYEAYGNQAVLPFSPPIDELNEILEPFGYNLFVYFKNLETGFEFQHNADIEYFGASVSKAVLALMIYKMAERGDVYLDTKLTFEPVHENWGSVIIQRTYPLGTQFTVRRLLELNLSESDNVATLMLRDFIGGEEYGLHKYQEFVKSIGGNPILAQGRIMNSFLTANEVGIFALAIHTYLESGGKYSEEFREHLLNNQFPFLTGQVDNHPPTASKTGWSRGVWHDMAIVYADSPFILVVMSRERAGTPDGTQQDRDDFQLIYETFLYWNAYWFPSE